MLALLLLFCVVFCLAIFINLWSNFKQSLVQTEQTLTLQSRLLERSITRTLESVESAILSIESSLASESIHLDLEPAKHGNRALFTSVLKQHTDQTLHFASHIRQIVITEGSRVIFDSTARNAGAEIDFNLMGLDFNDPNIAEKDAGLAFFSNAKTRFLPLTGQDLTTSRHSTFITGIRSASYSASGEFYWIIVALNPDYFVDFFLSETENIQYSSLLNVNVIDFNGDVLVSLLDHSTEEPPVTSFLQSGHNQQYYRTEGAVHSLVASSRYPLIVTVSKDIKTILSHWWQQNDSLLVWLSGLVLLLISSGGMLFFEFRRRLSIQRQMAVLSRAVDQSNAAIILTNSAQAIEYINPSAESMFGYPADKLIGRNPRILASGETDRAIIENLRKSIQHGEHWQGELINRTREGDHKTVSAHISSVVDDAHSISHFVAVMEDITERRQAEEDLQLAASVFSNAQEGILITNINGIVINVNEAFTRITGYSRDAILGENPRILSSGLQEADFYDDMWRQLNESGRWYGEIWNRRKNGEVYAEMLSITAVRNRENVVQHYVAMFSDITSIKKYQDRLEHIAHFDALTNLPNRVLLSDRLHQGMAHTLRCDKKLAVVFLDLDGFKAINDVYGHDSGDELLKVLSQRMKNALRSSDTLARIGGDEFVAVLMDLSSIEATEPMLNRLLAAASGAVNIGSVSVHVSASLGVTFYPQDEIIDADQLQRQADQAMYQAKIAGKNRYHVFDALHDRSMRGHHEQVDSIRRALTANEFILHYQPKVNMRSAEVVGAEALIRWQHPQRGLLAPAEFLPMIENHPLAIDIGEWVFDTALTQIELWRSKGLELPVSVNIGALQLQHPDFVERLKSLLNAHPSVSPSNVEIEVLETSALEDIDSISGIIEACHEMGITFSLDDFGTGYSSLTYLKRLSVKMLKIDKSFVRDMLYDPDDLSILEGVISLARAFRRKVIAEGVETIEHGEMLLQLGCELAQGYGIARPMPADQMPVWVTNWRTPVTWKHCQQLSDEQLMLLHASVEHRAWVIAIERFIRGEYSTPPPLDRHLCNFGQWFESERNTILGTQPCFADIDTLHQQVHLLGEKLYQLRLEGRNDEALVRLDELYCLRDTLLSTMKVVLIQQNKAIKSN